MIDVDRAALYAAERAAFEGTDLEAVRPFEEVAAIIDAVITGEWWPGDQVRVSPARRDSRSSSARLGSDASTEIRLSPEQTTVATAAHELAHALAGPAQGHGPLYRCAYLDVIVVITNSDPLDRRLRLHAQQLLDAFSDAGLAVGERRWAPPEETTGTAIAL
jgi:hypothetical protein